MSQTVAVLLVIVALGFAVYAKGYRDGGAAVRGSVRKTLWDKEKDQ